MASTIIKTKPAASATTGGAKQKLDGKKTEQKPAEKKGGWC